VRRSCDAPPDLLHAVAVAAVHRAYRPYLRARMNTICACLCLSRLYRVYFACRLATTAGHRRGRRRRRMERIEKKNYSYSCYRYYGLYLTNYCNIVIPGNWVSSLVCSNRTGATTARASHRAE